MRGDDRQAQLRRERDGGRDQRIVIGDGPRAAPRGSSAAETMPPIRARPCAPPRHCPAAAPRRRRRRARRKARSGPACLRRTIRAATRRGRDAGWCDRRATASRTAAGSRARSAASRMARNGASRSRSCVSQTSQPAMGFTPARARRLVELDEAEGVGEIGQRQRRHAVAAAAATASSMRTVPSTTEYSLCSRRWTKDGAVISEMRVRC